MLYVTIDKLLNALFVGGQKLALPLVLSSELWKKTGRWNKMGGEVSVIYITWAIWLFSLIAGINVVTQFHQLFKLQDRKESDFLLAPTHEEEITHIVANELSSYRQLPIRLFQIGNVIILPNNTCKL
jgi:prolyl-tRNA synthetase